MQSTITLSDTEMIAMVEAIDLAVNTTGYSDPLDTVRLKLMDAVGDLVVCQCPPINEELEYLHGPDQTEVPA